MKKRQKPQHARIRKSKKTKSAKARRAKRQKYVISPQLLATLDAVQAALRPPYVGMPADMKNILRAADSNRSLAKKIGNWTIDDVRGLLAAAKGPRGAPRKLSTQNRIQLVRSLLAQDRSARSFALQVFPEKLTVDAADAELRKFRNRYRAQIEPQKARSKQS
jgi:hypothetical protein